MTRLQPIRKHPGWTSGLALALIASLSGFSSRSAQAAVPIKAELTFVYGDGTPMDGGSEVTEYVGIRLPDGEILRFGEGGFVIGMGIVLNLKVQFEGNPIPVDVTTDPSTVFVSAPERTVGWNKNSLALDLPDAGLNLNIIGGYMDKQSGVVVFETGLVKVRLFDAPYPFDAGPEQSQLISELDRLSNEVVLWASGALDVPAASVSSILSRLWKIRLLLQVWYTTPVASEVLAVGGELQALGLSPALMTRFSYLVLHMSQAGVVQLGYGADFSTLLWAGFFPPWVLPRPSYLTLVEPVTFISWLDLGDEGDW